MSRFSSRDRLAVAFLVALALVFWGRVLFTDQVLLPGAMLRGFVPFGGAPNAPWNILQWDSLGQYLPWRAFAGEELRAGRIPLWNPYEFAGTPFLANAQSAVFYPLNLPFWILDPARAFGWAALLHSLLALGGTFALMRRWNASHGAALLSAVAFAFSGYLMSWALLPTLFATAAWLPLCLLLFEKTVEDEPSHNRTLAGIGLVFALCCALLAGHAQIFFYVLLGLLLRLAFLKRPWRGWGALLGSTLLAASLGALQLLPTLELAALGHRQRVPPTSADWDFWIIRSLQSADLGTLFVPGPSTQGTLNENFGYIGLGVGLLLLLGLGALALRFKSGEKRALSSSWRPPTFALVLAIFGLLYALATPLAQLFFFGVPGVSQMGGPGRALLLWTLGAAILAGFGLDFARRKIKSPILPALAIGFVALELGMSAFLGQPTAPRAQIYPETALTNWLDSRVNERNRVLFYTPRNAWLPTEALQQVSNGTRTHPPGVLPPNGATWYRLHEVNGYDSLSPRQYRAWVGVEEDGGPSPQLNGNMVLLNNVESDVLDTLSVRYIVAPSGLISPTNARLTTTISGADVWERDVDPRATLVDGRAFYPGWRAVRGNTRYAPTTFGLGTFVSLLTLGGLVAAICAARKK